MAIIYISDSEHLEVQNQQQNILVNRGLASENISWSIGDLSIFKHLDAKANKFTTLIASFHGAIAATHWVAQNPSQARRLILLQPSLHLGLPNRSLPSPHFVPTQVHWSTSEAAPETTSLIAAICGKLFYDYTLQLTSEPANLTTTLGLLALID